MYVGLEGTPRQVETSSAVLFGEQPRRMKWSKIVDFVRRFTAHAWEHAGYPRQNAEISFETLEKQLPTVSLLVIYNFNPNSPKFLEISKFGAHFGFSKKFLVLCTRYDVPSLRFTDHKQLQNHFLAIITS